MYHVSHISLPFQPIPVIPVIPASSASNCIKDAVPRVMPSATWANIIMEMVDEDGIVHGMRRTMVDVTDTVSHLLADTWKGDEWRTYRLAYGLKLYEEHKNPDQRRAPTQLQWAARPLDAQYDPLAGVPTTSELCCNHPPSANQGSGAPPPDPLHAPAPPCGPHTAAAHARRTPPPSDR
jgi:hypothetical protein